jgi:hypothetical protein
MSRPEPRPQAAQRAARSEASVINRRGFLDQLGAERRTESRWRGLTDPADQLRSRAERADDARARLGFSPHLVQDVAADTAVPRRATRAAESLLLR